MMMIDEAHAAISETVERIKDPASYTFLTYLWVSVWAMAGGFVSFMSKVRTAEARPVNITEFIGELFTSGFVGVLTFWLCEYSNVPPLLAACFIGISGHAGSRCIFMFEKWAAKKVEAMDPFK